MQRQGFSQIIIGVIVTVIAVGIGGYLLLSQRGFVPEAKQGVQEREQHQVTDEIQQEESEVLPVSEVEQVEQEVITEKKGELSLPKIVPGTKIDEQALDATPDVIVPTAPIAEEVVPKTTECARSFSPQFNAEPYYTGPLFDAHFHMPISPGLAEEMSKMHGGHAPDLILGQNISLDKILCFFDKENVRGAVAFHTVDVVSLADTLEVARTIKEKSSDSVSLFLMPVVIDTEKLDNLHRSNAGLFKGYGELSFYDDLRKPLTPGSQKLLDLYDVAEKYGLVVMMHPDMGQKSDVEKALQENPQVKFLLHGFESEDYIADLMAKYPNVYFSIDSAVLYPMSGLFMMSEELFISKFKQDFSSILNSKLNKWKGRIESHPDRFMWGTDRGVEWHYTEEISILFEEFARAFIARLDPSVQENYAYKNAEKLLQNR